MQMQYFREKKCNYPFTVIQHIIFDTIQYMVYFDVGICIPFKNQRAERASSTSLTSPFPKFYAVQDHFKVAAVCVPQL